MRRLPGWIVVLTLVACAAFELALALGAGQIGSEPGENVRGADLVQAVGLLAMLVGVALALVYASRPEPVAALLAPAAAAFLVTYFFTFDPYYAPGERRYSDGGAVPLGWIVFCAVLAVGVGVLTRLRPREGAVATALVLLLLLVSTLFAGDGH